MSARTCRFANIGTVQDAVAHGRQFDNLITQAGASKASSSEIIHTLKARGLWDSEMWRLPWDSVVRYYALAAEDIRLEKKNTEAFNKYLKKHGKKR